MSRNTVLTDVQYKLICVAGHEYLLEVAHPKILWDPFTYVLLPSDGFLFPVETPMLLAYCYLYFQQ